MSGGVGGAGGVRWLKVGWEGWGGVILSLSSSSFGGGGGMGVGGIVL